MSSRLNGTLVKYNLNINDISGLYQQIMAACDVNDELTDEKIHAIAKEADRLWVLFVLNGIYDSNDFQDVSYRLNEKLKGLDMASYRGYMTKSSCRVSEKSVMFRERFLCWISIAS